MPKKKETTSLTPRCRKLVNSIGGEKIRQPIAWTYAKYDYTPVEQRIRYTIMYLSQAETDEETTETVLGVIRKKSNGSRTATIPISVLFGNSKSNNYDEARDAVNSYAKKPVVIQTDDGGEQSIYPFISTYTNRERGKIIVLIAEEVWQSFRDDARYYTEFDLLEAIQLRSQTAMRLNEIANTLTKPQFFAVDYIKNIFCLKEKYPKNSDFVRMLTKAAEELIKTSTSINIVPIKEKTGYHEIIGIEMTPVYNTDQTLREKYIKSILKNKGLHWLLSPREIFELEKIGFTEQEMCANIVTLRLAQETFNRHGNKFNGFTGFLHSIREKALTKINPQGYVINLIRAQLKLTTEN